MRLVIVYISIGAVEGRLWLSLFFGGLLLPVLSLELVKKKKKLPDLTADY
jgi:hypothetical protein